MKLFLACFLLFSAVLADECLDHSYAPGAAASVGSIPNVEMGTDTQRAFKQLYLVFRSVIMSRYRLEVFYAFPNDDYSGIIDCHNPFFNGFPHCSSGYNIFMRRSYATYHDTGVRLYHIMDDSINQPFYTMPDFFPSQMDWFNQSGWTAVMPYMITGHSNQIYSEGFGEDGGVAGATRSTTEPCGPCLTGSFPVPFARSYSTMAMGTTDPATLDGINAIARSIINTVEAMTNEIFIESYVGFSDGRIYSIGDCRHSTQDCSSQKGAQYILYTRSDAYFLNEDINVLYIDDEGNFLDDTPRRMDRYDATTRPWYQFGTGWADPFESATTGAVVRSYSVAFNGGVAASEIQLNSEGMCVDGRNAAYENEFYCGPAERVFVSLSLVLLAVVFALF